MTQSDTSKRKNNQRTFLMPGQSKKKSSKRKSMPPPAAADGNSKTADAVAAAAAAVTKAGSPALASRAQPAAKSPARAKDAPPSLIPKLVSPQSPTRERSEPSASPAAPLADEPHAPAPQTAIEPSSPGEPAPAPDPGASADPVAPTDGAGERARIADAADPTDSAAAEPVDSHTLHAPAPGQQDAAAQITKHNPNPSVAASELSDQFYDTVEHSGDWSTGEEPAAADKPVPDVPEAIPEGAHEDAAQPAIEAADQLQTQTHSEGVPEDTLAADERAQPLDDSGAAGLSPDFTGAAPSAPPPPPPPPPPTSPPIQSSDVHAPFIPLEELQKTKQKLRNASSTSNLSANDPAPTLSTKEAADQAAKVLEEMTQKLKSRSPSLGTAIPKVKNQYKTNSALEKERQRKISDGQASATAGGGGLVARRLEVFSDYNAENDEIHVLKRDTRKSSQDFAGVRSSSSNNSGERTSRVGSSATRASSASSSVRSASSNAATPRARADSFPWKASEGEKSVSASPLPTVASERDLTAFDKENELPTLSGAPEHNDGANHPWKAIGISHDQQHEVAQPINTLDSSSPQPTVVAAEENLSQKPKIIEHQLSVDSFGATSPPLKVNNVRLSTAIPAAGSPLNALAKDDSQESSPAPHTPSTVQPSTRTNSTNLRRTTSKTFTLVSRETASQTSNGETSLEDTAKQNRREVAVFGDFSQPLNKPASPTTSTAYSNGSIYSVLTSKNGAGAAPATDDGVLHNTSTNGDSIQKTTSADGGAISKTTSYPEKSPLAQKDWDKRYTMLSSDSHGLSSLQSVDSNVVGAEDSFIDESFAQSLEALSGNVNTLSFDPSSWKVQKPAKDETSGSSDKFLRSAGTGYSSIKIPQRAPGRGVNSFIDSPTESDDVLYDTPILPDKSLLRKESRSQRPVTAIFPVPSEYQHVASDDNDEKPLESVDDILNSFISQELSALDAFGNTSEAPPLFSSSSRRTPSPSEELPPHLEASSPQLPQKTVADKQPHAPSKVTPSPPMQETSLNRSKTTGKKRSSRFKLLGRRIVSGGSSTSHSSAAQTSNINKGQTAPAAFGRASPEEKRRLINVQIAPSINMRFGTERPSAV